MVFRGGRKTCQVCGKTEQEYYRDDLKRCVKCVREINRKHYYRKRGRPVPEKTRETNNVEKTTQIDLGLAVLGAIVPPGVELTLEEIGVVCGCSKESVRLIQNRALKRIRKRLYNREQEFREIISLNH